VGSKEEGKGKGKGKKDEVPHYGKICNHFCSTEMTCNTQDIHGSDMERKWNFLLH
jgi:hypothetical protein